MKKIKVLRVQFDLPITQEQLPLFRGAVISMVGKENILYHNHKENDEFRYAYPLIQYKRIHKKAALVCVGDDGTESIGAFFSRGGNRILLGNKECDLNVEQIKADTYGVQIWDTMFTYRIRRWLPLNQENYEKYMALDSIADKYAMLEGLLTGNVLSFAKGFDIYFDSQVQCKITAADEPRIVNYKGVKMMSFDAEFKTNVSLPDYVGLGKGVSLGMGTVVRRYEKNIEEQ